MQGDERFEIRLAGEGGQGLILAGVILAEAAAIYDGKNAVQTQSYGPEARGGASKSEVVISDGPIDYPKVIEADLLLCMSQQACDEYADTLKKKGTLLVDSVHVERVPTGRAARTPIPDTAEQAPGRPLKARVVRVPITDIAEQATGRRITANIVSLGLIVGLTGVVSREAIESAVRARSPKGTAEINQKALQAGFENAAVILADREEQPGRARRRGDARIEESEW